MTIRDHITKAAAFDEAAVESYLRECEERGGLDALPSYDNLARWQHARLRPLIEALADCVHTVETVVRCMRETGAENIDPSEPERQMYDAMCEDLALLSAVVPGIAAMGGETPLSGSAGVGEGRGSRRLKRA